MDTLSNTVVSCYRAMQIRSKKDAEKFLNSFSGTLYLPAYEEVHGEIDICIEGNREKGRHVSFRPATERGNIFSPYWSYVDPVEAIWMFRKYVNAKIRV